jgi:hypothetical protein
VLERSGGARGSFRQKLVKEGGAALRDAGQFFLKYGNIILSRRKIDNVCSCDIFLETQGESSVSTHKHWATKSQPSALLLRLLANEARTKQGECRALVVKGHMSNP